MKIIKRSLQEKRQAKLSPGKVLLLLRPRRVGKTFLLNQVLSNISEPCLYWSGEDIFLWKLLENRSVAHYRNLIGGKKLLAIDEAQKIRDAGAVLFRQRHPQCVDLQFQPD